MQICPNQSSTQFLFDHLHVYGYLDGIHRAPLPAMLSVFYDFMVLLSYHLPKFHLLHFTIHHAVTIPLRVHSLPLVTSILRFTPQSRPHRLLSGLAAQARLSRLCRGLRASVLPHPAQPLGPAPCGSPFLTFLSFVR